MQEYEEKNKDGNATLLCPHCGYMQDSPAKEAYHLPPGSILQGKYIVGRTLGYGGFGVTYVGYDAQLDRKVAIKEYLPTNFSTRMAGQTKLSIYDGENGEQFHAGLNSFIEEAKRLSKLNALPGTVDIYDSFLQNETGYIVMEYLDGKTIKEILAESGVFEYGTAKLIILGILNTLKEVHKEGIVHRDIAPDNIFILPDGEVRLIDFGASRYATTLHSKSLSVILKPGYAPEEQYRSRGEQGSWSDVYALAATFYKMITGITPEESMERMRKDDLKEPSKLGVTLPANDENAIMNALLIKATDRTQTADEFAYQLTAEDEVKRAASTLEKYDAGRLPRWARALASCLGIAILVFGVLVFSGIVPLRDGAFVSALSGEERLAGNEARVPNVVNENYDDAVFIAEEASLLLVVTNKEYNDKVEADKVMLQDPLPGRVQLKESALNVIVSAGAEGVIEKGVMPDIIFRTLEEAALMLEEAGIVYELVYEESDTVAKDSVIGTSVVSGEKVGSGSTVVITVSEGSAKQDDALKKKEEVFHVVRFVDWNGNVLSTQNVQNEKRAYSPGDPSRYGYRFTGWDRDFQLITSDLTVNARYEKIPEYTVVFRDWNGSVIDSQRVLEGGAALPPGDPYRVGYDFTGWSGSYGNVRAAVEVTAQYSPVPTYTVVFNDYDGKQLKSQTVNRGDAASPPAEPLYPRGYGFAGWDSGYANVRANLTVTAKREALPAYTVTFTDWDDKALKTQTPLYKGEDATAPANPSRTGYDFTGWSRAFTGIQGNLTVKAQYEIKKYTVTWKSWDNSVLKTETVAHGSGATPPGAPTREGHTFTGWNVDSTTNVTKDMTIVAAYRINHYTVSVVCSLCGATIATDSVVYDTWYNVAERHSAHDHSNYQSNGYRFAGWSPGSVQVKDATTVQANYTQLQYQYRDQRTEARPTDTVPSGGTRISSAPNYSAWSGWQDQSGWSQTRPSQPANTDVVEYQVATQKRNVTSTGPAYTVYQWSSWRFYNINNVITYFPYDVSYLGLTYVDGPVYTETTSMIRLEASTDFGNYYGPHNGRWWFLTGQYQKSDSVTTTITEYKLQKRTRTITGYNVTYWTAWSGWQDGPVAGSPTREVQTRDKP